MKATQPSTLASISIRGLSLLILATVAGAQNNSGSLAELPDTELTFRHAYSWSATVLTDACSPEPDGDEGTESGYGCSWCIEPEGTLHFNWDMDESIAYSASGNTITCTPEEDNGEEDYDDDYGGDGDPEDDDYYGGGDDEEEEDDSNPPLPSLATGAASTEAIRIGAAPAVTQANHCVASIATTTAINFANACAETTGNTWAIYEVSCPPETSADAFILLEGSLYVNVMPDETGRGYGYAKAGTSSICVDDNGTTSVRAFIDATGAQRYLVQFTLGAQGESFNYAEYTSCGATAEVLNFVDVFSQATAGPGETDVAGSAGAATAIARVDIYNNPDVFGAPFGVAMPLEGDGVNFETIITPDLVLWVGDSFPGDACMIDPFTGPSCDDDGGHGEDDGYGDDDDGYDDGY